MRSNLVLSDPVLNRKTTYQFVDIQSIVSKLPSAWLPSFPSFGRNFLPRWIICVSREDPVRGQGSPSLLLGRVCVTNHAKHTMSYYLLSGHSSLLFSQFLSHRREDADNATLHWRAVQVIRIVVDLVDSVLVNSGLDCRSVSWPHLPFTFNGGTRSTHVGWCSRNRLGPDHLVI
jgi:hypothetical protein